MDGEGKEGGERKMATEGFFWGVGNKEALPIHWFLSNFHLLSVSGFRVVLSLTRWWSDCSLFTQRGFWELMRQLYHLMG